MIENKYLLVNRKLINCLKTFLSEVSNQSYFWDFQFDIIPRRQSAYKASGGLGFKSWFCCFQILSCGQIIWPILAFSPLCNIWQQYCIFRKNTWDNLCDGQMKLLAIASYSVRYIFSSIRVFVFFSWNLAWWFEYNSI